MDNNRVCGIYSIEDLDSISLNIKNEISKLSRSHRNYLENRYKTSTTFLSSNKEKTEKLTTYLDILKRIKTRHIIGSTSCLERQELQLLVEKITRIIGKNCRPERCDIEINNSKEEEWVMKKPYCRSYEEWEKWAKRICEKLNLEIKAETEVAANLIFEVSREIINPNVLLAVSAYTEARKNLNIKVNRTDEQVKLDFELLVEKLPDTNLTLDVYRELISRKLSFDIVKTIYENNLSLEVTSESVQLKTPVNIYNLVDIEGDVNVEYLKKFGMKPTITKKDLLQDYK